jgi:hypothetical protein
LLLETFDVTEVFVSPWEFSSNYFLIKLHVISSQTGTEEQWLMDFSKKICRRILCPLCNKWTWPSVCMFTRLFSENKYAFKKSIEESVLRVLYLFLPLPSTDEYQAWPIPITSHNTSCICLQRFWSSGISYCPICLCELLLWANKIWRYQRIGKNKMYSDNERRSQVHCLGNIFFAYH